ncbi:MAG TPA: hypothetical protein DGZ24_06625 [Rhodospirillaceae bacterium]|nr:hypothetical protein [Candidatus Neomarinimicrobiota bacterium]HCX14976.1 hypothetical protein [Rhodospirillaceae bacterium]
MAGKVDAQLKILGIELPKAAPSLANYVPFIKTGNLVFVSGQLPMRDGTLQSKGLVGHSIPVEEARAAAKQCAINLIAQAKVACDGNLDCIKRVVKLTGFVASGPDFTDHPKVVNGASDTMVEVFGDAGHHARAAVGSSSLPLGASVEIEAIFEIA